MTLIGVAFGDPEKLMNATLFEMNYASWGRRVCTLCSQEDVAPQSDTPPDEDVYQVGKMFMLLSVLCLLLVLNTYVQILSPVTFAHIN